MGRDFEDILYQLRLRSSTPIVNTEIVKAIGYEIFKKYFSYREKEYDTFFEKVKTYPELMEKFDNSLRFYFFWCKRRYFKKILCITRQ